MMYLDGPLNFVILSLYLGERNKKLGHEQTPPDVAVNGVSCLCQSIQ